MTKKKEPVTPLSDLRFQFQESLQEYVQAAGTLAGDLKFILDHYVDRLPPNAVEVFTKHLEEFNAVR